MFAEVARQAIYVPETGSSLAGAPFENFLDGILLFVDPATGQVFDSWWSASDRFETVDVVPLQDATARRAILIPAQVLGDERHRLQPRNLESNDLPGPEPTRLPNEPL